MSVRDVAYRVTVDGADAGTAKLKGVSTAIDGVSAAATNNAASTAGMAEGFGSVEAGLEKVTGPAGKALRVLNDVGDVFRLMGAGLAGGALFGGLQDIAEAMAGLADKAGITKTRVDALVEAGANLSIDLVQRSLGIDSAAEAMDRYAKSIGRASAAALTFGEEQAGLAKVASGEIQTRAGIRNEAAAAREILADITRARLQMAEFGISSVHPDAMAKLDREESRARRRAAEADRKELEVQGLAGGKPVQEALDALVGGFTGGIKVLADNLVKGVKGVKDVRLPAKSNGTGRESREASASWDIAGTLEQWSFDAVAASDDFLARFQPVDNTAQNEAAARQQRIWRDQRMRAANSAAYNPDFSDVPGIGASDKARLTFGREVDAQEGEQRSALASMVGTDEEKQAALDAINDTHDALRGVAAQSKRSGDAGRAMFEEFAHGSATSAAAALYMGESLKVATNIALQQLAVKAGGEVIWETAQGIAQTARYIASYGLNAAAAASAAEHFSAAAMFAAISGGAALGAVATGGFGSGGGAGGVGSGGQSGPSGGMSNPGRGGGEGSTVVMVHIGGELVTRGVTSETRKQELRGGLSESRLRRAS